MRAEQVKQGMSASRHCAGREPIATQIHEVVRGRLRYRSSWRRVAIVGVIAVLSYSARGRLYVNLTGSLPIGIYGKLAGVPERGDLVVACLPRAVASIALARGYVWAGNCPGKSAPIGKRVVATSGDTVTVSASGIAVNGVHIEHTMPVARDSRGRYIEHVASGRYVLGENELWLLSTHHALSFDSRYFGPVAVADVVSRVRPISLPARNR